MANAVLIEDFEVIPRLTTLGLPKEIMLDILDQAAVVGLPAFFETIRD
jgi:hypothetical protein